MRAKPKVGAAGLVLSCGDDDGGPGDDNPEPAIAVDEAFRRRSCDVRICISVGVLTSG